MTYGDHVEFFDREIATLSRMPVALTLPQILTALDIAGSPEADSACLAFSETLSWPRELKDLVRFEIGLRLNCARWWCLRCEDEATEGENIGHLAKSLLIDYWHDVGRVDWIHDRFVKEWAERNFPGSTGP